VIPFRYEQPQDTAGAVALLAETPGGAYLGGGTNLVDHMRLGVAAPELLVDVTRILPRAIEELADGGLRIGAGVRNSELGTHAAVRLRFPLVAEAVLAGASPQLRNLATTGGNLLQRTRCVYFQDVSKPCNKREPGSGCPAREGHHRNLAILGHSAACVATHPSDLAVALTALDALVCVQGPAGDRTVPITDLYRLPGDEPQRDTTLEHGELITAIELAPLPYATRRRYRKVRERASYSFALVSVAAALHITDGVLEDARIALGGVAHVPWRAREAEAVLRGERPGEELFRRAAEAELAAAQPLRDNAFKVPLAANVIVRTLMEIA
jgi:xanthine dehydrogenase YagS FAD-binding subunit